MTRKWMLTPLLAVAGLALVASPELAFAKSSLAKRWVGKEAGTFFAAYGPPTSDMSSGSKVIYGWRGGYSKRKVPAVKDKNGKTIKRARVESLVCQVKLTVDRKYYITAIEVMVDKPGINGGPTWCEEFLDAAK